MSSPPWEVDRPLTLDVARAIVRTNFPQVDSGSLTFLGSGWEFDVFQTEDGWAFRFPRRAEAAELFDREARVHELVSKFLPAHVAIPRVELIGRPGAGFPYEFAGHRFIPGESADAIDTDLLPVLEDEIGTLLGAIHAIPEDAARAAGITEPAPTDAGPNQWIERCLKVLPALRGIDPTVDRAITWVMQESPLIRRYGGPLRPIHQDLSSEHLIADPRTGRLTGVLDWTDAILGDPARDFVFLVTWRGWAFVDQVLNRYPLIVDTTFRDRLRRPARVLSVLWLAEAHERGWDVSVPIHRVRNAFDEAPASQSDSRRRAAP